MIKQRPSKRLLAKIAKTKIRLPSKRSLELRKVEMQRARDFRRAARQQKLASVSPERRARMKATLDRLDVRVERLRKSLEKLPARYPGTMRYAQFCRLISEYYLALLKTGLPQAEAERIALVQRTIQEKKLADVKKKRLETLTKDRLAAMKQKRERFDLELWEIQNEPTQFLDASSLVNEDLGEGMDEEGSDDVNGVE